MNIGVEFSGRARAVTRSRRAAAGCVAILLLQAIACSRGPRRPDLLLLVIDSLRHDHMGCYGYSRPTTPRMDRLAGEGARFVNAISQAPWTTPSMASVLTSLYPSTHGVVDMKYVLDGSIVTLAEVLRDAGYRTGAATPAATLRRFFQLDQGFDDYFEGYFGHNKLSSHFFTDRAIRWITAREDANWFYWIHYWDPHYNYRPSREVRGTFVPEENRFGDRVFNIHKLKWQENALSEEEIAYNIDRFDEEILFTDRHVGRLLDFLDESGRSENTLVVVIADHGEQFQEHGWLEHTNRVYENLIRVPLLMRLPGRIPAGLEIDAQVELIDLMPTVLDLLGVPLEGTAIQGRSLAGWVDGSRSPGPADRRPAFSETQRSADQKSIRDGEWKYIHDYQTGKGELYDLGADPGERNNLVDAHPERAEGLRARLERWREAQVSRGSGPREIDPDLEEKLRSLGYLP